MRAITSISMLAFGLLVGAAPVRAADIVEEPIYEAPIQTSGWYLRGDVGYNFESETKGDYAFYNQFPGVTGIDDYFLYDSIKLRDSVGFGAGAGYRFNDHIRADVTVDYFNADVDGNSKCPSYLAQNGYNLPFVNDCHFEDSSKADVWTAMANAYVDVAHFGPITPYVGAGAGFAYVKYDDLRNEIDCGTNPICVGQPVYVGIHEGLDDWRFAASLMAGVSIDITQKLKLDAGYKYTRISEGDAFGYDEADKSFGATGVQGRDHGFDLHALRAGLRYEFF